MNWKITLVLAILLVLGALAWFFIPGSAKDTIAGPTNQFLEKELTPDSITRIEIGSGDRKVVLDQTAPGEWSLPGKWPVRGPEVRDLVESLTKLRSRFIPIPIGDKTK